MKLDLVLFSVTSEDQRKGWLISVVGQLLVFDQWNFQVELYGRGTCAMKKIADWRKKQKNHPAWSAQVQNIFALQPRYVLRRPVPKKQHVVK